MSKKDVMDLFLGTRLGPRSYSIIEQGMISQLIDSKPEELRVTWKKRRAFQNIKKDGKRLKGGLRLQEKILIALML